MLVYSSIICKDATNCSFFIFVLNALECDRCFFELCLLFLRTYNSRIILFSLIALLYSYNIVSIRLRDDIISTSSLLYVYFDFASFHILYFIDYATTKIE
jgi:hypothetical protein